MLGRGDPFPLGKASSILVPPKPLSRGKFSHCFLEGLLSGQKSQAGEDQVGELRMKVPQCWKRGMRPKCMSVHECVYVWKYVSVHIPGRVRSLKGEGVLGAEKEVSIHVVLQGILITLSWETLLTNRALFPWGRGRAPSAGF